MSNDTKNVVFNSTYGFVCLFICFRFNVARKAINTKCNNFKIPSFYMLVEFIVFSFSW